MLSDELFEIFDFEKKVNIRKKKKNRQTQASRDLIADYESLCKELSNDIQIVDVVGRTF